MQARAGTTPDDYSDYELGRAVVYMADAGGAKFPRAGRACRCRSGHRRGI